MHTDEIRKEKSDEYNIVGIIDDNKSKIGNYLNGVKILGDRNDIAEIVEKENIDPDYIENDLFKKEEEQKEDEKIYETLDAAAFNPDGLRGNILEQCSAGICIYGR